MNECEWKKSRREYMRAWRKRNPDKVKRNNEAYWRRRLAREKQEAGENG